MGLDVTEPHARIEALRAEGVEVSLFAHVVRCIAVAMAEHSELNVSNHGRKLMYFEDVDVNIPVERKSDDGSPFPMQLVVRRAQDLQASEIYAQITAAKAEHARTGSTGKEDRWSKRMMSVVRVIPPAARVALLRTFLRNGKTVKRRSGTTLVSSVGKFASIPGYVFTFGPAPRGVAFVLGSVVDSAVVHEGAIKIRKVLALTAIFNHDVVDGGPAARFATRLKELVESGADIQ